MQKLAFGLSPLKVCTCQYTIYTSDSVYSYIINYSCFVQSVVGSSFQFSRRHYYIYISTRPVQDEKLIGSGQAIKADVMIA
jgi:hypothetical protein